MKGVLIFAAVAETMTGVALLMVPSLVGTLLLGEELIGVAMAIARVAGITLIAFGVACWPGRLPVDSDSAVFRAMLTYNALIALYLTYLGTVGHMGGVLLWPGVVLHAVVALLLVWTWRNEHRVRVNKK